MKGLKCTTANCEHNEGYHCMAGVINISKNATCRTKVKRENGVIEQEFINMELAQEFDYSHNEELLIECDSIDCKHNANHRCKAQNVDIGDSMIKTKCFTKKVYD